MTRNGFGGAATVGALALCARSLTLATAQPIPINPARRPPSATSRRRTTTDRGGPRPTRPAPALAITPRRRPGPPGWPARSTPPFGRAGVRVGPETAPPAPAEP